MPKRSSKLPKPKRSSKQRPPTDENEAAYRAVAKLTGLDPQDLEGKNPAAVALGRLGGKKGGPARAASLTPEERRRIAREAAKVRWHQKQE